MRFDCRRAGPGGARPAALILAAALAAQAQTPIQVQGGGGTAGPRGANAPAAVAEPVKPEDRCTVEGNVYNGFTGEPLRKANLILRRAASGPGDMAGGTYLASTDAAGHYAIPDVDPGRYSLMVDKAGFVTQSYGAKGAARNGAILTLQKAQKLKDITFKLTPHGVITGRILDEDGDPVANVAVQLLRSVYYNGRKQMVPGNSGMANDLGEYRIAALAPGKYYMSAVYRPGGGYGMDVVQGGDGESFAPTYYPGTTSMEASSPVEITAGAQLRGMDIRLRRTKTVRVRGKVLGVDGKPARNVMINLVPQGDGFVSLMAMRNMSRPYNAQGDFVLSGVAPGSYTLTAMQMEDNRTVGARVPVEVGTSSMEGVTVQLARGEDISGHIKLEGTGGDLSGARVMLTPKANMFTFGMGPQGGVVKEDGAFTLSNVQQDHYDLRAFMADGYLKSVRLGDDDVTDAGLDFRNGVHAAELTVVMSMAGAKVEGVVQNDKSEIVAGATVVLIPEGKRRELERYYSSGATDQNGRFTIKTVIPGEYRVYAFDSMEQGSQMDPDWMKRFEGKGEQIKVDENGHETLQLKVLSGKEE